MYENISQACPFEDRFRASQCGACCEASPSLPPCVKAWLGDALEAVPSRARASSRPRTQFRRAA